MWELDHKEGWAAKNWCFWIVVLEKTLENILYSIEIKPIHPKGNQPWICTVRTGDKAEASVLWPLDAKGRLIGKDPDAEKDWGQEEKGTTVNEVVGWHHQLNGHDFGWTPGSWWWTVKPGVLRFMGSQRVGYDWTTELNWTELFSKLVNHFTHNKRWRPFFSKICIYFFHFWFHWVFMLCLGFL